MSKNECLSEQVKDNVYFDLELKMRGMTRKESQTQREFHVATSVSVNDPADLDCHQAIQIIHYRNDDFSISFANKLSATAAFFPYASDSFHSILMKRSFMTAN